MLCILNPSKYYSSETETFKTKLTLLREGERLIYLSFRSGEGGTSKQ